MHLACSIRATSCCSCVVFRGLKYVPSLLNMANKVYTVNSKIGFGKYKGMTIREILDEDSTYVTKFLQDKLGFKIVGDIKAKPKSDRTWGYNADEGLLSNYVFYREYYVVREAPYLIRHKETRLEGEGSSLGIAEWQLNTKLDEYYTRR